MTVSRDASDNSASALEFDFWPSAAKAEPEPEPDPAPEPAEDAQPSPEPARAASAGERLAWGAIYGARRAVAVVAAVVLTSLLLTMIVNQDMTLVEAINLYRDRIASFIQAVTR